MQNFFNQFFELVLIPLIIALGIYAVNFIRVKAAELKEKIKGDKEDKYIDRITEIVTLCVITTTQTYVDSLKKQNVFDKDAQLEAFNKTKTAILNLLNEELTEFIIETFGDLNEYINAQIEATVNYTKEKANS
jgi:hypothetical protein